MAFEPPNTLPDYTKLITSLNASGVQSWNPELYSILKRLIAAVQQSQDAVTGVPAGSPVGVINIGGSGGGGSEIEYLGDIALPKVYNDGDIVVGTDGIAYLCTKDGTTTVPTVWPGGGGLTGPQGPVGPQGPPGTIGPHHATHEPGGTDPIQNAAWVNLANTFTANQTISVANPVFLLNDPSVPANSRIFQIRNVGQIFDVTTSNDNFSGNIRRFMIDRLGNVTLPTGNLLINKNLPDAQLQFLGSIAKAHFGNYTAGNVYLTSNLTFDGTAWQRDDVASGGALFFGTVGGAFGLYNAVAGANPATITPSLQIDSAGNTTTRGNYSEYSRISPLGHWANIPLNTGISFTASGGATWTVEPADINSLMFALIGKTIMVGLNFATTTLSANCVTLNINLPGGYNGISTQTCSINYLTGGISGNGIVFLSGSTLTFYRDLNGTQWLAGTNNLYINGTVMFPIS